MSLSTFIKPTRYTRLPYLLLGMLLLSACELAIGDLTEYEEPRLVVNALITAQADSQLVHLRMTGFIETEYVDNAEVDIRRNGESFYQYVTMGDPAHVLPTTDFIPGDQISIDVRKDGHHAKAETVVPSPILITGIDTLSIKAKRHKWSTGYEPHTRYMVHLKLTEDVNRNEMQYFRVEVRKEIHTVSSLGMIGSDTTDVHHRIDDDHTLFGYWGDPALCETENADQENMSVSFDWLDGIENIYHTFRSNYFKDGEYTLRLDLPHPRSYISSWGWDQHVCIRIFAISRTEYNYLQALAAMKTLDTGTIYDSEPGVTTNVMGGAGIFCVESLTQAIFNEDHELIPEK